MSDLALFFSLGAALIIGALLTVAGAVGLAGMPITQIAGGLERDIRPIAAGIGAFGLILFMAAASAALAQIATPV
ncbi:hypothetical protein [Sphingomonas sp. Leaf4]|uniref:hypothetical protein n=1 Tax=Sphingomonas sp. Leaf4 TaxID=2876553 RepID=UPI001E487CC2|nr:hypothetical protein [Sphingomonas sp. Leaf4]